MKQEETVAEIAARVAADQTLGILGLNEVAARLDWSLRHRTEAAMLANRVRPHLEPVPYGAGSPTMFLMLNPDLWCITMEAEAKLHEYFQPLEVRRELREGMLFLVARVTMLSEEAVDIGERLDEEWWLDRVGAASGRLQITFEHVLKEAP